jgi:hypothetical protein
MSVKLDDLVISGRIADDAQGTISEVRGMNRLGVLSKRRLIEHRIAGAYGSIISDTGRQALKILVEGEFVGENSMQGITQLRSKYRAGKPVEFTSEITVFAQVKKVLLEELQIFSLAGLQNNYRYRMLLREYKEPPPPSPQEEEEIQKEEQEETQPSEQQASKEAEKQGEIDDIRGQILDAEGNPAKGIKVKIRSAEVEYEPITTDENGYYELLDVPEGKYEITCDAEGFEDMKAEVEIKKSSSNE